MIVGSLFSRRSGLLCAFALTPHCSQDVRPRQRGHAPRPSYLPPLAALAGGAHQGGPILRHRAVTRHALHAALLALAEAGVTLGGGGKRGATDGRRWTRRAAATRDGGRWAAAEEVEMVSWARAGRALCAPPSCRYVREEAQWVRSGARRHSRRGFGVWRMGESTEAGLWTRFLRLPSGALRAIERMREKPECMRFAGQAGGPRRARRPAVSCTHRRELRDSCSRAAMIGWINLSVESFIRTTFGDDVWAKTVMNAHADANWLSSCPYPDSVTYELRVESVACAALAWRRQAARSGHAARARCS